MTISIALKVGDGVVLGTDSASVLLSPENRPEALFVHAEKMLNLVPGLPVGLLAYGVGDLENRTIGRLARDLGSSLGTGGKHGINPRRHTLEEIGGRVWDFFHARYVRTFGSGSDQPLLGFILAGYSAGSGDAEVWSIRVDRSEAAGPVRVMGEAEPDGLFFQGTTEPLSRLVRGASETLYARLLDLGLSSSAVIATLDASVPLWHVAMPLEDAAELVRYLAEVAAGYERFTPGIPLIAPPIELAVISPHDGFRWLRRKQWGRSASYIGPSAQPEVAAV
jgi:hypothetical protein